MRPLKPLPPHLEPLIAPLAKIVRKLHKIAAEPPKSLNQTRLMLIEHGLLLDHHELRRFQDDYTTLPVLLSHVHARGLAKMQAGMGKLSEANIKTAIAAYRKKPGGRTMAALAKRFRVTLMTMRRALILAKAHKARKYK